MTWRASLAFGLGAITAAATMHPPVYIGPMAKVLGGADLSWLLGLSVAGGSFAILTLTGPMLADT